MKLDKGSSPTSGDKRLLTVSIIIFLASAVIAVLAISSRNTPSTRQILNPATSLDSQPVGGTPLAPEIISQLTAIPSAQPLTGPLADEVHAVAQMVATCDAYSNERRSQMNQHIAWLLQPATLPQDVTIALGNNINGGLLFGMATYTLSEWGQHAKASDSCLLTIGKKLNELLTETGGEHFNQFDS